MIMMREREEKERERDREIDLWELRGRVCAFLAGEVKFWGPKSIL